MLLVVETPKWSRIKYKKRGDSYVQDIVSPFPSLFNYGFIEDTTAEDEDPVDVIILGARLAQGSTHRLERLGVVHFLDAGKNDDKIITALDGKVTGLRLAGIHVFFTVYSLYKRLKYFLDGEKRGCSYRGVTLGLSAASTCPTCRPRNSR